jgi:hypothetical protein
MTTPEYLRWVATQGEVLTVAEMEDAATRFDDLLAAAETVLAGLNARIIAASDSGTVIPVFDGIAALHAAIAKAKGEPPDEEADDDTDEDDTALWEDDGGRVAESV